MEMRSFLFFFPRAIREGRKSRRSRLQMSLVLNNRRRVLNLVWLLFDYLFPKEHHSSSSSSCSPSVSFRINLFCTLKSATHRTPPNCLLSTRYSRFQIRNTAYRSGLFTSSKYHFVPSNQEESISSRSSRHFFFQKIKKQAVCA